LQISNNALDDEHAAEQMVFCGSHGRTHASHWRQSQRTYGMRQSLAKLPDQLQEADEAQLQSEGLATGSEP